MKKFILCAILLVSIGSTQYLPAQTGTDAWGGDAQPNSKLYQELTGNNGKGQKSLLPYLKFYITTAAQIIN